MFGSVRVSETTLDNGLRVVVAPQHALHRTSVGLYVGVGSRYETPENNGISHFLEHMLYRGTARHPSAHALNLAFERLGGNLYAATHSDHTYVSCAVPPVSTAGVIDLLAEVVRAPRLGEVEVERRIVREEILENLDEDGREIDVDNVARMATFGDHALGYTITGPVDALDRFDEPKLRAHLRRYYVAQNALLVVAGACDAKQVIELARKHLSRWAAGERQRPTPFVSSQKTARRRHVASPGSQTDLRLSFLTPGDGDAMAPAIELLMRTIDDGMSTRLYQRLADDGGLVYDCSASWEPFAECGVIDIGAEVQHERLPRVLDECLRITRELADAGPTKAELEKARARHRWSIEATLDDAEGLGGLVGGATFFDRPRDLAAQAARYDGLTQKHVAAAARFIFRPERLALITVGSLAGAVREKVRALVKRYAA